jgi:hypothetical protein
MSAQWRLAIDHSELRLPPAPDTDTQVARAIMEAAVVASVFARLASEARPELAARCEHVCNGIRAVLDERFPGALR